MCVVWSLFYVSAVWSIFFYVDAWVTHKEIMSLVASARTCVLSSVLIVGVVYLYSYNLDVISQRVYNVEEDTET